MRQNPGGCDSLKLLANLIHITDFAYAVAATFDAWSLQDEVKEGVTGSLTRLGTSVIQ